MRRGLVAFSALTLVGAALLNRFEQREPWRAQAEEACLARKLVQPGDWITPVKEMDGPGVCGMTHPFRLTAVAGGEVALRVKMTLACPMIPEIDAWFAETVQPAAELYLGTRVAEMNAGSYACRGRNNQAGAKLSEHSFGNAIDIMAFKFADGRAMSIERGWKGEPGEQDFLREIFLGACQRFTTVLAPGSNVFHYNHIHVDLARHDPRGLRHYCKPVLKFAPRLGPGGVVAVPQSPVRARPALGLEPAPPQAPIDVEEDDPYGAGPTSAREAPAAPRLAQAQVRTPAPAPARPVPARVAAAPFPDGPAPLALAPPVWSAQPIY